MPPGRALDLFVSFVSDQQDLEVVSRESHGLAVHLGDQRAGGVDGLQLAIGGTLNDSGRDAMCAEDDVSTGGHLVDLFDEDRSALLERLHHVDVVHDLLAHVHGGTVMLERFFDGDNGAVHSCTVPTGLRAAPSSPR